MNQKIVTAAPRRANYGVDAPGVVRRLFILGGAAFVLGWPISFGGGYYNSGLAFGLGRMFVWMGGTMLMTACAMLWGSKRGKFRLRDKVLDSIKWRGDEQVLDVGCGHGLMLIGAAKRLTTGKATGVDIWQQEDQAGNSAAATLENVNIEGVAERVELKDGDARQLPFADETFDVVLSSWALHNIYDAEGRAKAVREIIRVLKPGGQIALIDIRHTGEYEKIARAGGLQNIKRKGPNFLFVTPSFTLTATKS
jgi:SAM-dependent methyltransferase